MAISEREAASTVVQAAGQIAPGAGCGDVTRDEVKNSVVDTIGMLINRHPNIRSSWSVQVCHPLARRLVEILPGYRVVWVLCFGQCGTDKHRIERQRPDSRPIRSCIIVCRTLPDPGRFEIRREKSVRSIGLKQLR